MSQPTDNTHAEVSGGEGCEEDVAGPLEDLVSGDSGQDQHVTDHSHQDDGAVHHGLGQPGIVSEKCLRFTFYDENCLALSEGLWRE